MASLRVRRSGVFIFVCIHIIGACTTVEKPQIIEEEQIDKQAAWELHRITLETIQSWTLKGRVAGKSNEDGFRAGVRWEQRKGHFDIDLLGPLGRKVAKITGGVGDVQLNTSKGESFSANDPELLMQELFGYSLPINGMQYWMRGIPDPEEVYGSIELDEQGRLKQLHQSGWVVDYDRYHDGAPALPAFIKITSATINANVKIDTWKLKVTE